MKILLIPVTGRNGFRKDFHVSNSFWFFALSNIFSLLAQMQQDNLLKKEFGIRHSVIHPSTRISIYVFLSSSECHGIFFHALCSHQRQVNLTKPVWKDGAFLKIFLKGCYCSISESEWSRLAPFQCLAYNGQFWNHHFSYSILPDWLGPVMHFHKQINVLEKNIISFLIKTNETFTLARGFYQVLKGKH